MIIDMLYGYNIRTIHVMVVLLTIFNVRELIQ